MKGGVIEGPCIRLRSFWLGVPNKVATECGWIDRTKNGYSLTWKKL